MFNYCKYAVVLDIIFSCGMDLYHLFDLFDHPQIKPLGWSVQ